MPLSTPEFDFGEANVKEGKQLSKPLVGLIVPPRAGEVPPDAEAVYPHIGFIAEGLGLEALSVAGYDSVISSVEVAAKRLRDAGADAVSLMGTSLSLYRGKSFNDELVATMRTATGLPVTTMSTAIVDALRDLSISRPAVASAYTTEVHTRLLTFLQEEGFDTDGEAHLSVKTVNEAHDVEEERVMMLGAEAVARSSSPDGALISCGGLRTARAVNYMESAYGMPVVTSPLAGLWASVRLVEPDVIGNHPSHLFRRERA